MAPVAARCLVGGIYCARMRSWLAHSRALKAERGAAPWNTDRGLQITRAKDMFTRDHFDTLGSTAYVQCPQGTFIVLSIIS